MRCFSNLRLTSRSVASKLVAGDASKRVLSRGVAGDGKGRTSAAISQSDREHTHASSSASDSSKRISKTKNRSKDSIAAVRGTRDFYPDDHRVQQWIFNKWKSVASKYGFEQYDAPMLESEELYVRKAGEDVTQQLYNFEDKGGRMLALRPEMTPSLARMVLAKKKGSSTMGAAAAAGAGVLSLPLKWFAIPQCWRYERMTRGRRREHYQWNMDIVGVQEVGTGSVSGQGCMHAEAEIIAAAVDAMSAMGLTHEHVGIKINSRKILTELMLKYDIDRSKWVATCVLLDKIDRRYQNTGSQAEAAKEIIKQQCADAGVDYHTFIQLIKDTTECKTLCEFTTLLGENSEGIQDLRHLFNLAHVYGYSDWLVFDATIVRGLAYYTGIVFEGFDRKGEFRAIFGGGRYDNLLKTIGGNSNNNDSDSDSSASDSTNISVPAVGFGFGDAVIIDLLQSLSLLPSAAAARSDVDVVICCLPHKKSTLISSFVSDSSSESTGYTRSTSDGLVGLGNIHPSYSSYSYSYAKAVQCAMELRNVGLRVDLILQQKSAKWVLPKADKLGVAAVVIIDYNSEDEDNNENKGEVQMWVKNMSTKEQTNCQQTCDVLDLVEQAMYNREGMGSMKGE